MDLTEAAAKVIIGHLVLQGVVWWLKLGGDDGDDDDDDDDDDDNLKGSTMI